MLKAIVGTDSGDKLVLGLSYRNLEILRNDKDGYIKIDRKELGLPMDIMIFAGETELKMMEMVEHLIGPSTKIHIDPKLKSG